MQLSRTLCAFVSDVFAFSSLDEAAFLLAKAEIQQTRLQQWRFQRRHSRWSLRLVRWRQQPFCDASALVSDVLAAAALAAELHRQRKAA
ncbi:hypothetical protein OFY05_22985 (plasmid) [Pseudocitrobacter faecalis]|nr:hypothetical protein OFY05_22985 [Pseudocitrobacter faecalis]